jgi:hypothetical protein
VVGTERPGGLGGAVITIPEQCRIGELVEMTIFLNAAIPMTGFVTSTAFDIEPSVQQIQPHNLAICTLIPQHSGRQIIEIEMFYRTARVFYAVQEVNVCAR